MLTFAPVTPQGHMECIASGNVFRKFFNIFIEETIFIVLRSI